MIKRILLFLKLTLQFTFLINSRVSTTKGVQWIHSNYFCLMVGSTTDTVMIGPVDIIDSILAFFFARLGFYYPNLENILIAFGIVVRLLGSAGFTGFSIGFVKKHFIGTVLAVNLSYNK